MQQVGTIVSCLKQAIRGWLFVLSILLSSESRKIKYNMHVVPNQKATVVSV